MLKQNQIHHGDCFEIMQSIPDKSIDTIIADLPYGVTRNKQDIVLPFDLLWKQYERIIKDNGAIILFAQGLFIYPSIWDVKNLQLQLDTLVRYLTIFNRYIKIYI